MKVTFFCDDAVGILNAEIPCVIPPASDWATRVFLMRSNKVVYSPQQSK